jgi:hypothetical protein
MDTPSFMAHEAFCLKNNEEMNANKAQFCKRLGSATLFLFLPPPKKPRDGQLLGCRLPRCVTFRKLQAAALDVLFCWLDPLSNATHLTLRLGTGTWGPGEFGEFGLGGRCRRQCA